MKNLVELTGDPNFLYVAHDGDDCLVGGQLFTIEFKPDGKVFLSMKDLHVKNEDNPWYAFTHVREPNGKALMEVERMVDILQKKEHVIK